MALWGNKDTKAINGIVDVEQNSKVVTGTGTAFTTELKVGNTLVIAGVEYIVETITSNTVAGLKVAYAGTTATGLTVTANEQPNYVPHAQLGEVFGVNETEAQVAANKAKGITTPGWVKYTTYTDSNGRTRNKVETLVAAGTFTAATTGDAADDSTVADA